MSLSNPNLPKSVLALRTYNAKAFLHDLLAGITVGLVALPLAMAFGIASGVTPQAGLYTAVVAGFLISALGGSRTQIGGPTGAFVVIVAGIVARFGMPGLALVTLMAGIMLVVMGLTGLGASVRFIPRPVIIGFTNGIAVLIASTQIKDFFGLSTGPVPSEFLPRMRMLAAHFSTVNLTALALGAGSLAILLLLPRITKRVPASIVAVVLCTVTVAVFHLPVETIGTKFGGIPSGLPPFAIPNFHSEHILPLLSSAFTVAMLAALESMLSAVVADGMTGDRHNPNVELVAQRGHVLLVWVLGVQRFNDDGQSIYEADSLVDGPQTRLVDRRADLVARDQHRRSFGANRTPLQSSTLAVGRCTGEIGMHESVVSANSMLILKSLV